MSTPDELSNKPKACGDVETLTRMIPDQSLLALIDEVPDRLCSVIVEADLPKREFAFADRKSKRLKSRPHEGESKARDSVLADLAASVRSIVGDDNANVLKSSGVVVINALAKQLRQISQLPNVKAIRSNRQLPPIKRKSIVVDK